MRGRQLTAKALNNKALQRNAERMHNQSIVLSAQRGKKMPRDILAEMRLFC
jgi:hypothetical protein